MDEPKGGIERRIRAWVEREFAAEYVDRAYADLLAVLREERPGNEFEKEALKRIIEASGDECQPAAKWEFKNAYREVREALKQGTSPKEIAERVPRMGWLAPRYAAALLAATSRKKGA